MNRYIPFLILIIFVSIIGVSTYKINDKQHLSEPITDVGQVKFALFSKSDILLPEFTLPNLYEGEDFVKEELLGQYSVVNFFASWCTTCVAEHKVLMRLKQKGVIKIYGVAWRDIRDNTRTFLEKHGNPYDIVVSDSKALFSKITGIKAVPETLIVDPSGRVVYRYQGNLQAFFIDEIERFVIENGG